MATNDLEIPGGIKPVNAVPVDAYYGPYISAAAACTAVPLAVRSRGIRKVGIIQPDGSVLDYWWPNDQSDAGLVAYKPDISTKADKTYVDTQDNNLQNEIDTINNKLDQSVKTTDTPTFSGINIGGANPTILRKTVDPSATPALVVDTYTGPNQSCAILDLRATNSTPGQLNYSLHRFYSASPFSNTGNIRYDVTVPRRSFTIAGTDDVEAEALARNNAINAIQNSIAAVANQKSFPTITARDAYNVTGLPFSAFITDDGDGKWALYQATTTGPNATYVKLSDPDLLNAAMTAAQIKTAYESNADTNQFTNALLTKLNGISAGATANEKADYLAVNTGTDNAQYITPLALAQYLQSYGIKMAGIDIVTVDALQQRGITWQVNYAAGGADQAKIFLHSTGDGLSQHVFMVGDNGTAADNGTTQGWLFIKDVITEPSMPNGTVVGNSTVQNIAGGDKRLKVLELNMDNFKYLGWNVWHKGNINDLKDAIGYSSAGGTPQKANKAMPASVTTGDNQLACSTALSITPINGGYVGVHINGIAVPVGDGVKTTACYFSNDNGSTARTTSTIQSGDKLYWNGSIGGFQLDANDLIYFTYNG